MRKNSDSWRISPVRCEFSTGGKLAYVGPTRPVNGQVSVAAGRSLAAASCGCLGQVAHSHQIVGRQCEAEHQTVFTKNRDRLPKGEVAEAFFAAVLAQARQQRITPHFARDRLFIVTPEQSKYTTEIQLIPDHPSRVQEVYVFLPSLRVR
jgi:hypothetical protein